MTTTCPVNVDRLRMALSSCELFLAGHDKAKAVREFRQAFIRCGGHNVWYDELPDPDTCPQCGLNDLTHDRDGGF